MCVPGMPCGPLPRVRVFGEHPPMYMSVYPHHRLACPAPLYPASRTRVKLAVLGSVLAFGPGLPLAKLTIATLPKGGAATLRKGFLAGIGCPRVAECHPFGSPNGALSRPNWLLRNPSSGESRPYQNCLARYPISDPRPSECI